MVGRAACLASFACASLLACRSRRELATAPLHDGRAELSFVTTEPLRPELVLDLQASAIVGRNDFVDDVQKSDLEITMQRGDEPPRVVTCRANDGSSASTHDDKMKKRPILRGAKNECDLGGVVGPARIVVVLRWRGAGAPPTATARLFG
jgi:hypothetical protein